ncbi:hypothetical protein BDR22DRAFT_885996 [Usnea florida]
MTIPLPYNTPIYNFDNTSMVVRSYSLSRATTGAEQLDFSGPVAKGGTVEDDGLAAQCALFHETTSPDGSGGLLGAGTCYGLEQGAENFANAPELNNAATNAVLTLIDTYTFTTGKADCPIAMAAQNHHSNPIIVEPTASPGPVTRSPLLTPSLHASSSSGSFESSRPQSRDSSATSPSESSPPASRSGISYERSNISHQTPQKPQVPNLNISAPIASVSSELTASSSHGGDAAANPFLCRPITRRWLEHALSGFTLAASLVGLLFIGVRTYKLAVISTINSTLDGCVGLVQAQYTTLEESTPLCKAAMKHGPLSSPYHLGKRAFDDALARASRWIEGLPSQRCGFPYISCRSREASTSYQHMAPPTIAITATLALGTLILIVARQHARSTEVFTSPARSDIQIVRREDSGPKIVAGQAVIERHHSKDHDELGQIHKRIRSALHRDRSGEDMATIQPTISSSTTIVNRCSGSEVSLKDRSSGEDHDGLIELQFNGKTKAFLSIDTGVFFRLKHWKGQHGDDSDSSSDTDALLGNGNEHARRKPGAAVLAKGRATKDKWIDELQLATENWHNKLAIENWHNKHSHPMQQAGDCLAGLLTNERPGLRPQNI